MSTTIPSATVISPAVPAAGRAPEAPIDSIFVDRWSRKALSTRTIPSEHVRSLFEAARWAPSASNAQPWLFIFNDDLQTLERARLLLNPNNRAWAHRAPLLIFVFARKTHPETGKPLRTGAFDTGAAWLALALQAHRLGLSTRAMGGIDHESTYQAFGVPRDQYESMAAIAVAYPGAREELPPELAAREVPSTRRAASSFAFRGRYPL